MLEEVFVEFLKVKQREKGKDEKRKKTRFRGEIQMSEVQLMQYLPRMALESTGSATTSLPMFFQSFTAASFSFITSADRDKRKDFARSQPAIINSKYFQVCC
jgi:hypothetical protein